MSPNQVNIPLTKYAVDSFSQTVIERQRPYFLVEINQPRITLRKGVNTGTKTLKANI